MESSYDSKKLKEYEVKVLDEFVKICEEHNIEYFITYGTLLGAIRHKGFIPWDDDVDVHLKPEEYYKFMNIMKDNPYDNVFYQSIETDKYYPILFAKLRMNNTLALETTLVDVPMHHGIYVDIFPLIPYPLDLHERKIFNRNVTIIHLLIEADLRDKTKYNTYGKGGKILSRILRLVPRTLRNKIASGKLKKIIMFKGEYDSYIDVIDRATFPCDCFDKRTKVIFEGKEYFAPAEYDRFMRHLYGDYMTLPSEEERKSHSFYKVSFDKGE